MMSNVTVAAAQLKVALTAAPPAGMLTTQVLPDAPGQSPHTTVAELAVSSTEAPTS